MANLETLEVIKTRTMGIILEEGDIVEVPKPSSNDSWEHLFKGQIIGFSNTNEGKIAQVLDNQGYVFDVEIERLVYLK